MTKQLKSAQVKVKVLCFPLLFIFLENFKSLYSCVQCLLREQNILERGVELHQH